MHLTVRRAANRRASMFFAYSCANHEPLFMRNLFAALLFASRVRRNDIFIGYFLAAVYHQINCLILNPDKFEFIFNPFGT